MQLKPIEINLRGAFWNWTAKQLSNVGLATKADLPAPTRAGPDVVVRSESTPMDRMANFIRFSETQFIWLAMQNPWAFSNARLLGHIVAEGEMRVQERNTQSTEKWDDVESHNFEKIIEARPNKWMSQYYVWLYQTVWYLMKGEAYWMVVKNELGEPIELYPLPASRVLPIPGTGDELFAGFAYSSIIGETPTFLLPEDICYHRFPNIFQYFRGWSNLNAYLVGLQTDREAAEFDLRDYEHGLELKQIVSFRPDLDDSEFLTALQDLIDAQEDGLRYMGIRGGDLDVKNVTQRRADSSGDVRDKMASMGGRIFSVFDGFWDKSANRASSERAEENTISYGAWPIMRMFAEDMTAQVVIPAYGADTRVVFDDIRPRNIELDIKEEEHEWSAMTWDEVQDTKGRSPHPDPDIGKAPYSAAARIAEMKVAQNAFNPPNTAQPATEEEIEGEEEQPEEETGAIANILRLNGNGSVSDNAAEAFLRLSGELRETDLRKWKTVCLRMINKGKRPEGYNFESNYITQEEMNYIRQMLTQCETMEDVKALFTKQGEPFVPSGAEQYQPTDPTEDEIAQLAEDEAEEFSEEFDELMPELETLLEAEKEDSDEG